MEAKKDEQERIEVIREIIQTEKVYIQDLQVLIRLYIEPIKQQKLLSKQDIEAIFANVTSICEFHIQLESSIPDVHSSWSEFGTVFMKCFLSLANFLKIYQIYCNAFKNSTERIAKCEKENLNFANFLKETQNHENVKGLTLNDYLIKPVQRLCKYPLLFRQLLKVTSHEHPDYKLVQETCEKLNQVTESVNENAAEIINLERLNYFNNTVAGITALYSHDWYIRDGMLSEIEISGEKTVSKERHVWLLSGTIIITRPPRLGRKKEQFLRKIDLDCNSSLEVGEDPTEFELFVYNGEDGIRFGCTNVTTRNNWVNDIKNQLQNKENQIKAPRNPLFTINKHPEESGKDPKGGTRAPAKKLRRKLSLKPKNSTTPTTAVAVTRNETLGRGSDKKKEKKMSSVDDSQGEEEGELEELDKKSGSGRNSERVNKRSRTSQAQARPSTNAQIAVELIRQREEIQQFKEERESWLKREAELTDRIRFLESQLYRLLAPQSTPNPSVPVPLEGNAGTISEYRKISANLRNMLNVLDRTVLDLVEVEVRQMGARREEGKDGGVTQIEKNDI